MAKRSAAFLIAAHPGLADECARMLAPLWRPAGMCWEDALSISNLGLLQAAAGFKGDQAEFRRYAIAAVRNEFLSELRRERQQPPCSQADDVAADREGDLVDALIDLEDAIDSLPPAQARAVRLRFGLDGRDPMTLEALATNMRLSFWQARRCLADALQTLRDNLA